MVLPLHRCLWFSFFILFPHLFCLGLLCLRSSLPGISQQFSFGIPGLEEERIAKSSLTCLHSNNLKVVVQESYQCLNIKDKPALQIISSSETESGISHHKTKVRAYGTSVGNRTFIRMTTWVWPPRTRVKMLVVITAVMEAW